MPKKALASLNVVITAVTKPLFRGLATASKRLVAFGAKMKAVGRSISTSFSFVKLNSFPDFLHPSSIPTSTKCKEEGCRKSGKEFNLTIDELGDMLDTDMTGLTTALEIFGKQMGHNMQAPDKGKKKAKVKK